MQTATVLPYQPPSHRSPARGRRLGLASCVCWGVVVLWAGFCVAYANWFATGWDRLAWIVYAVIGSWVGCGIGALLGLIGMLGPQRRQPYALPGLALNLVTGLAPLVYYLLVANL